jgi:hypothetical protein
MEEVQQIRSKKSYLVRLVWESSFPINPPTFFFFHNFFFFSTLCNTFKKKVYTNLDLDGNVQAASIGSSLEAIIRPKRQALLEMRNSLLSCISKRKQLDANLRIQQNDSEVNLFDFEYPGYYSDSVWGRTKEDNALDAKCLVNVWPNYEDSTTVLQYFLGSSGYIAGDFTDESLNVSVDTEYLDSRTLPSYVFGTTYQKEVVIILDFMYASSEYIEAMKDGAIDVINGLYDSDYVQLITSTQMEGFNCGGTISLIRMTSSNKEVLIDYINTINTTSEDYSNPTELFDNAYQLFEKVGISLCQPVILYVSASQLLQEETTNISLGNTDYGARIYTFAIQTATNTQGYLGGGEMYNVACDNEGVWYNIETPSNISDKMIQYQLIIQRSRVIEDPNWFVSFSTFGPKTLGMVISGFLPVYTSDRILIGVVSIEFTFSDIQDYLNSLTRGLSFAFVTTWQGDLLIHPSYRDPSVVSNLPVYYDCSLIENSESFMNEVRLPLVTDRSGEVTITVDRPLPKGDIGTEGFATIPIKTTFFWTRLESLPFVVALAYTDAELRSPVFRANNESEWLFTSRMKPLLNESDLYDYVPADYMDDIYFAKNGDIYHFKYTAAIDNTRSFNSQLQNIALSQLSDGIYAKDSYMVQPNTSRATQTFYNRLRTSFNQNPGFLDQFTELSHIGTQFARLWREDAALQTNDPTSLRYAGFYTSGLITWPGLMNHFLSYYPYFYSRERPWYQRAESNPGVSTIAPPYLDAAFGGKVTTVSKAIMDNPNLSLEESLLVGVVGVDYPYEAFHSEFTNATGCAYNRSLANDKTPMCYLMDNSGLLILSPEFLTPTYNTLALTNSDNLPLGIAEPQLAADLVQKGVLQVTYYLNFRGFNTILEYDTSGEPVSANSYPIDTPQQLPQYTINTTVIQNYGGIVTGLLNMSNDYCVSGNYTLQAVEGTNVFLIYIENYSRYESDNCRSFEIEQVKNISFDVCEQNGMNYPTYDPVCPNSDQRASVTEKNRPDDALCDLVPPKEKDYVSWGNGAAIAMVAIASFLIIFTCILLAIIFKYRNTPVILMSSPFFVYIQFFGFILGYTNIYLWTGEPTHVQCGLRPWIASISFVLIVGPMFAKTYRVWKMFSGKGFFAKTINDATVLLYVTAMIVPMLILCIIWCAFEIPSPTINNDDFDDNKVTYRCDGDSSRIFEGVMIGYCGSLVLLGTFFAFRARKASSHFNEARFIGFSIYSISFCGVVGVTLTYVLLGLPLAYYLVFCVTVMLGILCTTMFVYFPKIRVCLFRKEKNIYERSSVLKSGVTAGTDVDD